MTPIPGKILLSIVTFIIPIAHAGLDEGIAARERGDYAAALREFRPLAEQGNADAQANLGLMYVKGQGVPHDFNNALEWYRKAAMQGVPGAQHFVGVTYAQGHGVHHDDVAAVKWLRKAAERGYAPAQYRLGLMVEYGWGVFQDPVEAYKWYGLAAGQDDTDGQRNQTNLEKRMTPEDLTHARALIDAWMPCGEDRPCP